MNIFLKGLCALYGEKVTSIHMQKYHEVGINQVNLTYGYWSERLQVNAWHALYHQYEQLDKTGCLNNFALASGTGDGFREGFFFADSDAYKWLEAAALSLSTHPDAQLQVLVDDFISVLEKAQQPDGYLYTYNQIHFPGSRWQNLQVEHEMYCLGHLIEAGVSHNLVTGQDELIRLARKAADLLVKEFMDAGPDQIDGHEEIEIALLRLYDCTGEDNYRELARRLIQRRGRVPGYGWRMFNQLVRTGLRILKRDGLRKQYYKEHPDKTVVHLPPRNAYHLPRWIGFRLAHNLLSGRFTQSHQPVADQLEPVGHAVRFVYLQTARTMLANTDEDSTSLHQQEGLWQRMLERRMYVTGGLGALPLVEGFGRDDELPDKGAYAETCAALGSIFWNHELALLTGKAQYDDLLEWQLYNAASVGASRDGGSYLYNNPLTNQGEIERVGWYDCPCCPSNLSRTWSNLGRYAWSWKPGTVRLVQFISSRVRIPFEQPVEIELISNLPWRGQNRTQFYLPKEQHFIFECRMPAWAKTCTVLVNGKPEKYSMMAGAEGEATASGYDPRPAGWIQLERTWQDGDVLEINLDMHIKLYRQASRVPGCGGKVAVGYGPLLYCLELPGQPDGNLEYTLLEDKIVPEFNPDLLGGTNTLHASTKTGEELTLIPYLLWGNRGPSAMTIFFGI